MPDRILVVDDAPENVDVLGGILGADYRIKVALNGEKALRIAESEDPPDLILLDVVMPDMDGYEVCRRLKANPKTRDIPVIFVTAKNEDDDEALGFKMGAVDYLAKPVNPPIVHARVKTHLALQHSRTHLSELSLKLSRYLSPQIYQAIFEGKSDARIQVSRKKLTIFFSDIVGFSAQTDSLEPEDLVYVLNSYLNQMAAIVLKHGGTLDKFIGDAVLVFFGDPESRGVKEDAEACVRMALEMRGAIADLKRDWIEKGITNAFDVRMGITTGYCTVGNFGSEQRMDYTIIGNQVNLASRLQSHASAGEILIGHDTFVLVRDGFSCAAKDPIRVKGFEQPVQAYELTNPPGDISENSDAIELSLPGCQLQLDPAKLADKDRAILVAKLEKALSRIR